MVMCFFSLAVDCGKLIGAIEAADSLAFLASVVLSNCVIAELTSSSHPGSQSECKELHLEEIF